jgi:probable lipoprotein NlpC
VKQVIIFILFVTCLECNAFAQGKKKQKKIDAVVAEAHSFIGTPYQYGGIGYGGIDCSGLICNSLKAIDVNMPRVSVDQSKVGSKKNWKSIRPGDLVFFKFKEKGNKWYHAGLITSVGENEIKFIHASSSRGVVESNLNESYYRENVKKFRRVIK